MIDPRHPRAANVSFVLTVLMSGLALILEGAWEEIAQVVAGLFGGLLANCLIAQWQYRASVAGLIDKIFAAMHGRDHISIGDAVRELERGLSSNFHEIRLRGSDLDLVQTLVSQFRAGRAAADGEWAHARSVLQEAEPALARVMASPSLEQRDREILSTVSSVNKIASIRYCERPPLGDDDPYQLCGIADQVHAAINDCAISPARAIGSFSDLLELAQEASLNGRDADAAKAVRGCLLDTLVLGCTGLLIEQRLVVSISKAEGDAISAILARRNVTADLGETADVAALAGAVVAGSLRAPDHRAACREIAARWERVDGLIMPTVFLRANWDMLCGSPGPQLESCEETLRGAENYFADELAVVRLNRAGGILNRGLLATERAEFAELEGSLRRVGRDAFYYDGIREVTALGLLHAGEWDRAMGVLESLAATSTVFPVRASAARKLLSLYARAGDSLSFTRVQQTLAAMLRRKGVEETRAEMQAVAVSQLRCTPWFFLSLPVRKRYYPYFVSLGTSRWI